MNPSCSIALLLSLAPAQAQAEGGGLPWKKDAWGVELRVPAGWRSGEHNGALLMGSDSEAGLIVVRYLPKTTKAELVSGYQSGVNEGGVRLSPSGEAQEFKAQGGTALSGELSGATAEGSTLKAQSVAVLSRWGGAAVVFGLTDEAHFAGLRPRVEEIAKSLRFREPKAPQGAEVLAGRFEYVYVSKSGSYSREAKITLCADGRFTKGGELAGSGSAGSAVSAHNNGGTWSSEGDGESGQLTLLYGNGATETLPYRVSRDPRDRSAYGPAVSIGDTKYQRTGDCR